MEDILNSDRYSDLSIHQDGKIPVLQFVTGWMEGQKRQHGTVLNKYDSGIEQLVRLTDVPRASIEQLIKGKPSI